MTTQITVRLPDDNVAWLDAEVAAGRFPSRTAGLAKLLTKAQRRQEDEADMLKSWPTRTRTRSPAWNGCGPASTPRSTTI